MSMQRRPIAIREVWKFAAATAVTCVATLFAIALFMALDLRFNPPKDTVGMALWPLALVLWSVMATGIAATWWLVMRYVATKFHWSQRTEMLMGLLLIWGGFVLFITLVISRPTRWWEYYEPVATTIIICIGYAVFWISQRFTLDLLDVIRTRLELQER